MPGNWKVDGIELETDASGLKSRGAEVRSNISLGDFGGQGKGSVKGVSVLERFEYDISTHTGSAFRKVAYFCSQEGECWTEEVPAEGPESLVNLMNERGLERWELVQFVFGKDGIMAFWKRRVL